MTSIISPSHRGGMRETAMRLTAAPWTATPAMGNYGGVEVPLPNLKYGSRAAEKACRHTANLPASAGPSNLVRMHREGGG